jgi:predicted ATPase
VLRRLAIFSGPFTLEAAQQVTSGSALPVECYREALSNLVAKSLVSSSSFDQIRNLAVSINRHFWLLGGTRAFARQRMEDGGEAEEIARRHAVYLCEFLERTYMARPSSRTPRRGARTPPTLRTCGRRLIGHTDGATSGATARLAAARARSCWTCRS